MKTSNYKIQNTKWILPVSKNHTRNQYKKPTLIQYLQVLDLELCRAQPCGADDQRALLSVDLEQRLLGSHHLTPGYRTRDSQSVGQPVRVLKTHEGLPEKLSGSLDRPTCWVTISGGGGQVGIELR